MKSLLLVLLCILLLPAGASEVGTERCSTMPWSGIAAGGQPRLSGREFAGHTDALVRLYVANAGLPVWFRGGVPSSQALALATAILGAQGKGLDPADYDAPHWPGRMTFVPAHSHNDDCALRELDLAFSVAALRYVSDVSRGRVDPKQLGLHLAVPDRLGDPARFLLRLALAEDPLQVLGELEPPFRRYGLLLRALGQYRELAADPLMSRALAAPRRALRSGDAYGDLALLAYKLRRFGDLPATVESGPGVYTESLAEAVRRFQGRHGLVQDGILGRNTLAQINVPMDRRVTQIALTLERWRWLPHDLGHRPVVINVPEYRLYAFEPDGKGGYQEALTMKVIVGQAYPRFQTPVFRGAMSYIEFSPYWNVPWSITRRELMPLIQADPDYLRQNHYEIVASYLPSEPVLPATPENIARLPRGELLLRQTPGSHNALGVAKFMFPNDHNVYLHGTPAKGLFRRGERAFSHGCIRLAEPRRLAEHVLSQERSWDRERVDALIDSGRRTRVALSEPLAVYVLYGTALADEDGTVRFMQDIYGHDGRMARVLGVGSGREPAI